MLTKFGTQFTE